MQVSKMIRLKPIVGVIMEMHRDMDQLRSSTRKQAGYCIMSLARHAGSSGGVRRLTNGLLLLHGSVAPWQHMPELLIYLHC